MGADPDFPAFERFIATYRGGRAYSSEAEMLGRFGVFKANLKLASDRSEAAMLRGPRAGQKLETHGVTMHMDLTPDEFKAKFTGLRPPVDPTWGSAPKKYHARAVNISGTAASIDWNARGALTPIKNQGQCGSCWAFSATEQLESDYFLKYGQLKELSPQQITSCTTNCKLARRAALRRRAARVSCYSVYVVPLLLRHINNH